MALASTGLRRAAWREWVVLAVLLGLLTGGLGWQNGLGRIDFTFYDAAIGLRGRAPSPDIVIVAIDEASLGQIGRWPWTRGVHAALLNRISPARPKAIALDLILAEPEAGSGDALFAQAIERAAPVVLPVLMESGNVPGAIKTSLPVGPLAASATALGHIHVELDADGIARSVFLLEGMIEKDSRKNATWPHLALALREAGAPATAAAALPGERNPRSAAAPGVWRRDYWMRIPFAGPPGTFTQVSYADVLHGKVAASVFTGKYVLVGATAAGLGDAYPTPVSGRSRAMPGIEIHANVLDTLVGGRAIVRAAPWANALASTAIVLLALLALLKLTPRRGLAVMAGLIGAVLTAAWALQAFAGVWFAPGACLLGLILGYPLWSWRRLEATLRFLGDEFRRIQSEPDILPSASIPPPRGADLLERRILAFEVAAGQLRDTRRFVADTLSSHPDGVLVTDIDGSILLANRAAADLFGMREVTALRGQSIQGLLESLMPGEGPNPPVSWQTLRDAARRSPANEPAVDAASPSAPVELTTAAGRSLLVHCARGAGAGGATLGWIVSLIDVTALRTAEQRRDEALAFLSHDMRSPQSSILALLELHSLDPANHPKEVVHARIESYVRKTLNLSEQFLQVSSAETKQYQFEMADPADLCSMAIDDTWDLASQKNIGLRLQAASGLPAVRVDRALLTRAIANLLSNAVKYSPDGTRISVTVGLSGTELSIEVADQGYGISAEDQKQLFTRYRRFSTPGQPKAAGAGLGMVFVKTVVDRHGGRVEFDSTPGRGTRFRLLLPLRAA